MYLLLFGLRFTYSGLSVPVEELDREDLLTYSQTLHMQKPTSCVHFRYPLYGIDIFAS